MQQENIKESIKANLYDEINIVVDVFQRYLTESFLEDMINGTTRKLIGGFHL